MSKTTAVPSNTSDVVGALKPIEINWFDEDEIVAITPRDQQRFEIQKDKAIEILRVAERQERMFDKQMNLLLFRLAEWIRSHSTKIETGFLTVHDASLAFVVVKNVPKLDDELEDSLAELDVKIANDEELNLIRLSTLALPPTSAEALLSFLDKRFLVSYDGKRNRPHQTGQQKSRLPRSPSKRGRKVS